MDIQPLKLSTLFQVLQNFSYFHNFFSSTVPLSEEEDEKRVLITPGRELELSRLRVKLGLILTCNIIQLDRVKVLSTSHNVQGLIDGASGRRNTGITGRDR